MKYFIFFRENNNFDDILSDIVIKKVIDEKISWGQHLMIGMNDKHEDKISYVTLKFGDEMVSNITKDFTPVPGVDYILKKDLSLFPSKKRITK
jgi:hypothetical protein